MKKATCLTSLAISGRHYRIYVWLIVQNTSFILVVLSKVFQVSLLLLVDSFLIGKSDAIFCYKCDHVGHPRDCMHVAHCNDSEKCSVAAYARSDGTFYYSVGCKETKNCPAILPGRKRDMAFCNLCCEGDYCNTELCDSHTETGKRCLSCASVDSPEQCETVVECSAGQECYTRKTSFSGTIKYELGCAAPEACFGSHIFGRKKRDLLCHECCYHEHNCNIHLCNTTTNQVTIAAGTTYSPFNPVNHCIYKNKTYVQGESWKDGCDYACTCIDESTGHYRCSSVCVTWSLPSMCHLESPPPGKCCPIPRCPAHVTINYPPGYIQH